MMDALAIEAAEAAVQCNYPDGAGAVLVIELDGAAVEVEQEFAEVERLCRENGAFEQRRRHRPRRAGADLEGPQVGVRRGRPDQPRLHRPGRRHPAHRAARGAARDRRAVRVVRASGWPTSSTPATATCTRWCSSTTRSRAPARRAEKVSGAILDLCIEHGGSITGEHGVGMDKAKYMPRMYTDDDLDTMQLVRCAFDPDSDLQPRQGLPDAAAVRRGARPPQGRPPAAGSRPGGGVLMSAPRPLDDARPARRSAPPAPTSATPASRRRASTGSLPGAGRPPASTPSRSPRCSGQRAAHGLTVVPRGRGTKMSWGTPPRAADVLLDLSAAGPGARPRRRRPHRRRRRRAPGWPTCRTSSARPASGSRSTRPCRAPPSAARWPPTPAARVGSLTGTARDLLIGITVVRADGVVAKAGGRVVKNVAGYDLGKLLIGSFGTLGRRHRGVVPAAPAARRAAAGSACRSPTRPQAHDAGAGRVHAQAVPAAVEVDWPVDGRGTVHVLLGGQRRGCRGPRRHGRDAARRGRRPSRRRAGRLVRRTPGTRGHRRRPGHRLKLTFVLSGLARRARRPRGRSGLRVRGSAGAGVVVRRRAARHASRRAVDGRATGCATPAPRHGGSAVVRRRARRGQGGRRRVGAGPGPRPDAPRQGPVRPGPPARAGTIRGRHLSDRPDEHEHGGARRDGQHRRPRHARRRAARSTSTTRPTRR